MESQGVLTGLDLVIDRSGTIVYKQVGFAAPDDLGAVADTVDESL